MAKRGLYANIQAKRRRIAAGSGEKMRKPGLKVHLHHKTLKTQQRLLKNRTVVNYTVVRKN